MLFIYILIKKTKYKYVEPLLTNDKETIHYRGCSFGVDCGAGAMGVRWGSPVGVGVGEPVRWCALMCLELVVVVGFRGIVWSSFERYLACVDWTFVFRMLRFRRWHGGCWLE